MSAAAFAGPEKVPGCILDDAAHTSDLYLSTPTSEPLTNGRQEAR